VIIGTIAFFRACLKITIFLFRPGPGKYLVDAIYARDFPIVQGGILFFAGVFVIVNLIVDLSYALVDPRIQYE